MDDQPYADLEPLPPALNQLVRRKRRQLDPPQQIPPEVLDQARRLRSPSEPHSEPDDPESE